MFWNNFKSLLSCTRLKTERAPLCYWRSSDVIERFSSRGTRFLVGMLRPHYCGKPSPDLQGYFNYSVMYYGSYSNETLVGLVAYDMKLAYFFTISLYMVLCGAALIFR